MYSTVLEGYINEGYIKSKNYFVDSIDFYIINLDRYTFDFDGTPTPQGDAVINGYANANCQEVTT